MLLLGTPVLVSSGLAFLLPETAGKFLPQTMHEALEMDTMKGKQDKRTVESSTGHPNGGIAS